jgi:hypothetical protein
MFFGQGIELTYAAAFGAPTKQKQTTAFVVVCLHHKVIKNSWFAF